MRRGRRPGSASGAQGQATVELALVLPVIVLALLLVVQVALVGLSQILVVQAARAAGRAAAVEAELAPVRAAARQTPGLRADRLSVERGPRGEPGSLVSVTVRYRAPTDLPLVGRLLGDVTLTATTVHRVEGEDPVSAPLPRRRPPRPRRARSVARRGSGHVGWPDGWDRCRRRWPHACSRRPLGR